MKRFELTLMIALVSAGGGCKASVSAEAKADKDIAEYDRPLDNVASDDQGFGDSSPNAGAEGDALVGARHDLQLAGDNTQPTCNCLAVAVGPASDPRFFWQAGPPNTVANQLVVALTSDTIDCPDASADSLGASYWGYKRDGENIVVVVEEARFGRPVTTGAIIPRPGPQGQVYVKPLNARVPYGRPLSQGDRYCRVQSPGSAPAAGQ